MPDQLGPELIALRDRLRAFADDELRPIEERADAGDLTSAEARREIAARSRAAGVYGMTQPREFGGSEAGPLALTVARETIAASGLRLARHAFGPGPGVLARTEGALRERYLEPWMGGERFAAWAFTEPRDATTPTQAVRSGSDYVVNGSKFYVSGGSAADFYAVLVNVVEDGAGPGGTVMLIVDRDTPGLTLGSDYRGIEGGTHCQLFFENVRVPQSNQVGAIGEGMRRGLQNIGLLRGGMAARATGGAMWACAYVRARMEEPLRAGGLLGDHEQARWQFGNMLIDTYAARSVVYRAVRRAEAGEDVTTEGTIAKVFATEAFGRVVDTAIQLSGGPSLIVGHTLEWMYRQARSERLAEGASDVLKMNIGRSEQWGV